MKGPEQAHTLVDERFHGVERLYGVGSGARLATAHVCVVGIGGVGSWVVEALARSGVGRLTLIDADDVCVSNTNRQLHAIEGQYGKPKVAVMAARARAINPRIEIDAIAEFLTPTSLERVLGRGYDVVVDACDAFRV
ncbi:MAG: ThiF family adenylyltransferase, partial [Dokdonella sp.]